MIGDDPHLNQELGAKLLCQAAGCRGGAPKEYITALALALCLLGGVEDPSRSLIKKIAGFINSPGKGYVAILKELAAENSS